MSKHKGKRFDLTRGIYGLLGGVWVIAAYVLLIIVLGRTDIADWLMFGIIWVAGISSSALALVFGARATKNYDIRKRNREADLAASMSRHPAGKK